MKVSKEDAILQLEKIKEPNRDTASPLSQVCGILRNTKMSSKRGKKRSNPKWRVFL